MDNKEIYKRTIGFSLRRILWDILAFIILIGFSALGFVLMDKFAGEGLIGLGIGVIVGAVVVAILLRYVSYTYKAGQIAMMTKGVTEGKLPDDVIGAGKKIVKERFGTVAAYFALTNVIRGIFDQIGRGITAVGQAIGGDTGNAVGSTISSAIRTIVAYLCDCCLGWVFYRKDEKATKATLEGAVLFFKHGKTLAKNLGRVFGIGLISFVIIGGVFGGGAYLIMSQTGTETFSEMSAKIAETYAEKGEEIPDLLREPGTIMIVCSAIIGLFAWAAIHSGFIRPFVLVGVLRNYIESGIKDGAPDAKTIAELDKKSAKFKKLHEKVEAGE